MGFSIEYNWYLVVSEENEISRYENSSFKYIIKSGNRMYPLNMPIPLIVKDCGCIAMVKITAVTNTAGGTIVIFDDQISLSISEDIKEHYYSIYKKIKHKD